MTRAAISSFLAVAAAGTACAAPDTLRSGYAEVNETSLYYELRGNGPALVLLQGAQLDLGLWDEQFEAFSNAYRVLRYDVRGFGRSGDTGEPFSHHADLLALLDFLAINRAHLVGLSLGGRIAVDLALEYPGRVGSLVLSGPGLSGWEWADDGSWASINIAVQEGDEYAAAEAWLAHPYMAPSMELPELRDRLRDLALANAAVWTRVQSEVPLAPPALGRLDRLDSPVLLLMGSRDVEDIQRIADLIETEAPNVMRVDVEGGGHLLNLEDPDFFDRTVLDFLRRNP